MAPPERCSFREMLVRLDAPWCKAYYERFGQLPILDPMNSIATQQEILNNAGTRSEQPDVQAPTQTENDAPDESAESPTATVRFNRSKYSKDSNSGGSTG